MHTTAPVTVALWYAQQLRPLWHACSSSGSSSTARRPRGVAASEAEPKGVAASEACSGEAAHLAQLELLAAEVEHLALLKQPARAARQVDQRPAAAVEPVKEHPS